MIPEFHNPNARPNLNLPGRLARKHGNVIRFLPALTIPFELIDEGFELLEACLEEHLA